MKKRVRLAPAPHDTAVKAPPRLLFFGLSAFLVGEALFSTQAPVMAQGEIVKTPKTTWAVQVTSDSRCARAPGFAEQLASQIPPDQKAAEADAELVAQVRVVRSGAGLSASIEVRDRVLGEPAGARAIELPASDCAATADALSLVLAVLVEAGRGAPIAEAEDEPEPAPALPPRPKKRAPRSTRYVWLGPRPGYDIQLGVLGNYGLLPGFAFGGTIEWTVRGQDFWPVILAATAYLPAETSDERARFTAGYGTVAVCPLHIERDRLRGRACPSFSIGLQNAEGRRFLESREVKQPLVLAGVELGGDIGLVGPLTAGLIARIEAPLLRQRFTYYASDGATPMLHQPKALAISSYVTVGLRFR